MKIVYYKKGKDLVPGIATADGIMELNALSGDREFSDAPLSLDDYQEIKSLEQKAGKDVPLIPEMEVEIGPCVPRPSKIICVGLNYRNHARESGMEVPKVPILFTKYANTLTGFGSDIPLGEQGKEFDYEVELGVVIGRECKNVAREKALDHVLGYCTANDLSCRDLQFTTSQWLLGKSLDRFLPLGKYLVTADEVGDPQDLQLRCTLNGETRQDSNTSDMIFSVAEIIEFVSKYMTLIPGDLILTGTPEGVIMGLPEKNWLKPGDVVKVEIEKLGNTVNKIVS